MIKFLAKLLISVSIIAYLITGADFNAISDHLGSANPLLLMLATSLLFVLLIPQSLRWMSIIRASGSSFRFQSAAGITCVGWFFNQVLPSSVGGDAFRIWYANRNGVDLSTATQSVVFDRISALVAITILLLLSTPWLRLFFSSNEPIISILVFVSILVAGCFFLMTADKTVSLLAPLALRQHIEKLSQTARSVFLSPTGARVIVLALLIHVSVACTVWLLALAMQIPLSLIHALLLMPVILFITAIPVSIAGWGLREGAMVFVYGMVGMSAESAFSLSIVFGITMMITGLPGGVVWWFMRHESPQRKESNQALVQLD